MNRIDYNGPGELWISDISDAQEQSTASFDRVITVCQDEISDNLSDGQQYNFYCMSDGPENEYGGDCSYELFAEAADRLYSSLRAREEVLIHCHNGQSRSVSVATAALGRLIDEPRHRAYEIVKRYRPQAQPDTRLMGHASTYIENARGEYEWLP